MALALLCLCAVPASGQSEVPEFEAYRMVQWDRGTEELGSRSASLSKLVVPVDTPGSLEKRATVLDFEQVTSELLDDLLDERSVGGLVIVLPADLGGVSDEAMAKWRSIEQSLVEKQVMS